MKSHLVTALPVGAISFKPYIAATWSPCVFAAAAAPQSAVIPVAEPPLLLNKTHKLSDNYESVVSLVTVKNCFGKTSRSSGKHTIIFWN